MTMMPRMPIVPGASSRIPLIDASQFDELQTNLGEELTAHLLRMFLDDLDQSPSAIAAHQRARDDQAATRAAHTLKGAALAVGCRRVATIAFAIERSVPLERDAFCDELFTAAAETRALIVTLPPPA